MKIVLTTHVFLPDHSAGTEILTFNTAKELQRLGHHVEICTGLPKQFGLPDSQRFDTYEYEGINVHRFLHDKAPMGEQSNVAEAEYNNIFFARWFRSYLKQFKPDIVHCFHLGLLSASCIDVCHELNIPIVMTPTDFWLICPNNQLRLYDNSLCTGPDKNSVNCIKHGVYNNQPKYIGRMFSKLPDWIVSAMVFALNKNIFSKIWFTPMVRALHQRADFLKQRMNMLDRVVVPTNLMEKILVSNGLLQEKVVFCRYGIDPTKFAPKKRLQNDDRILRIGFIGGISEHKGAHILINAIKLLPSNIPLKVKIYGRQTDFPKYFDKLLCLANNDPRIHFCGTFQNSLINSILSEIDVLVVPSIWYENTPLVIYSAQAVNCPVIASNLGGISEVIHHKKNGLLFKAGDIADLAHTLDQLIQDRGLLEGLSQNSIQPKPISQYAEELIDIYDKTMSGGKGYT